MVPVSVRAEDQRGALGNQVTAMFAPLPIGLADPLERFRAVNEALGDLKSSAQAVGAERLTQLAGFAAPTILNQAARLQARQRFFNLTVTNVPGPQFPLYVLGRRLTGFYPMVPLVLNTALGIAIMSYDGRIFFGLLGDYDAMADLDDFADDLRTAIDELSAAAGVPPNGARRSGRSRPASRRTKAALEAAGARRGACCGRGGLIALTLAFDAARPQPAAPRPGAAARPRSGHDAAAQVSDEWPTSGPHREELITRDRRRPSDDQILHALELGNVVILYDAPDPGTALGRVQEEVAGPFDAELAAAGQAVILARRPGAGPATALAWRRVYKTDDPLDPRVGEFAEAWLGLGLGE